MKSSKHLFFCSDIDSNALSKEESHHATKVLRLKIGDQIKVLDGIGTIADAKITEQSKNSIAFEVVKKLKFRKSEVFLHIAIAPTKSNERIEFFLEKCTEIGISSITPIITKNSERKKINEDRWRKIIISAAKQSQSAFFPVLNPLTNFKSFVKNQQSKLLLIAHCENSSSKNELRNEIKNEKEICILIGPEGDFTKEEINFAVENKYKPVSLGNSRLRTETAGIVACHTVNLLS
ncbi:MAG: 16S rRNA (uracil(1498)-N(3))-methyltransferase [Crocinitomicaceae bacterium]